MSNVEVVPYSSSMHDDVVQILARAFVDHPQHIAMFGSESLSMNATFGRMGLSMVCGKKVVAVLEGRVLGFAHWADEARCQPATTAILRALPAMFGGLGLRAGVNAVRTFSLWGAHDPSEPHLHLGPVAVDPDVQGRGVGGLLMRSYCEDLDEAETAGFLETHGDDNVRFYGRFGFVVVDEAELFGVVNIFMRRPSK